MNTMHRRRGRATGGEEPWDRASLDSRGSPTGRDCAGQRLIDPGVLDEVRDEMYPMLPLPPEWQKLEDGTSAPNWVAGVALSRLGRRDLSLMPASNGCVGDSYWVCALSTLRAGRSTSDVDRGRFESARDGLARRAGTRSG